MLLVRVMSTPLGMVMVSPVKLKLWAIFMVVGVLVGVLAISFARSSWLRMPVVSGGARQ